MGFYVNPMNSTKEMWLNEHGTRLKTLEPWQTYRNNDCLPVCLVDNGPFTAAAVAYCPDEQAEFADPRDTRFKIWYSVPIKKLVEVRAISETLVS